MLGRLQTRRGEPNLRVRLVAALIIFGMLLATIPIVMVPLVEWLADQV
jgi:hypothetical protein